METTKSAKQTLAEGSIVRFSSQVNSISAQLSETLGSANKKKFSPLSQFIQRQTVGRNLVMNNTRPWFVEMFQKSYSRFS